MTLHRLKTLTLPESGRVVVAHPDDEDYAIKTAEAIDVPYLLRRVIPAGAVHVLDLDAMPKVGEFWL